MKRSVVVAAGLAFCLFAGYGLVEADGSGPPRVRVEIDEWIDGAPSEHNYGMYIVAGSLRQFGFPVVNGRRTAWNEVDPDSLAYDMIFRAKIEIAYSKISQTYGETIAIMYTRKAEGRLVLASDTTQVVAEVGFDLERGISVDEDTVPRAFVRALKEAYTFAGNALACELYDHAEFKDFIPEVHRKKVAEQIADYRKKTKREKD